MAKLYACSKWLTVIRVLNFIVVFGIFTAALAALNIDQNFQRVKLVKEQVFVLEDAEKKLTIEQVNDNLSGEFKQAAKDTPNLGMSDIAAWLRFSLENQAERAASMIIEVSYPHLDFVDLYYKGGVGWQKDSAGDQLPLVDRSIKHRNPSFEVELAPAEKKTFYLRVETRGSMNIPVTVYRAENFYSEKRQDDIIMGVFFGVLAVMIFYNLFLFFSLRSLTYLIYVAFIAAVTLFHLSLVGFGYEYFWSESPWWQNNSIPIGVSLLLTSGIGFTIRYLLTSRYAPRVHLVLMVQLVLAALLGVATLFLDFNILIRLASLLPGIYILTAIPVSIYILLKGYRPALYFLIAWSAFLLGSLLLVLRNFGIVGDNPVVSYGMQIGSALEVVLLSLGLADRINTMRREKETAERESTESKLRMLDAVSRFVPREFIHYLGKNDITDVGLGDAIEKEMSVLFNDIRGFTRISEQMNVDENFKFLNSYLNRMGPIVTNHEGFIDKYMGDAIMAIFPRGADSAVAAAVEMQIELQRYNRHRSQFIYEPIEAGIGLHFGSLMLGTVGSENRLESTVIGDTVNLASRIESLTKIFKVPIIISDSVVSRLKEPDRYNIREIDVVRVRGRQKTVTLFEVYDADESDIIEQKREAQQYFGRALEFYRRGEFDAAIESLDSGLKVAEGDRILQIYRARCEQLLTNHPGKKWSGVSRVK